jgi:hypothetical protein
MLDFKKYVKEVKNVYNEQEILEAQEKSIEIKKKLMVLKEEESNLLKKKK